MREKGREEGFRLYIEREKRQLEFEAELRGREGECACMTFGGYLLFGVLFIFRLFPPPRFM